MSSLRIIVVTLIILVVFLTGYTNYVNAQTILPPIKQLKSGILIPDMKCPSSFMMIFKERNGSPACVHPIETTRLLLHGWISTEKYLRLHPVSLGVPTNNKTMNVTQVVQNIDSLYNKTISVYGSYFFKYPFSLPERPCRAYSSSTLALKYDDSAYVSSHQGWHFLYTNGDALEVRIIYTPTNSTVNGIPYWWYGFPNNDFPMIFNGTLMKQYVIDACEGSPIAYKSAYLLVNQHYLKPSQ